MEQHLQEIKLKQRKLIFMFGEMMYHLYKSQGARFLYTSEVEEKKHEVERIVSLLDYLEERIGALEEIDDGDELLAEESEPEEEEEAPAEEETSQGDGTPIVTEPEESLETEEPEAVENESDDEASQAEKILEPEKEDLKNVLPSSIGQGPANEPLPVAEVMAISVEEFESAEVAVNRVVAQESARDVPLVQERVEAEDILGNIFQTATFVSDADKRLFEKNLKLLTKGTVREREISINQMAHITGKETLRKVYEFAMKDTSLLVRLAVMKNISRMKDNESEGFFELGLNDPDAKIRTAAIKGLGSHVSDKHRETLEGLLKDCDQYIRGLAVTYLGIYYEKEGLRKAITAWTDESPYVRISLIEMLSIVKPEGALTTIKNLLSDREEEVKKAAEKALEKLMPERKREGRHEKRKK